MHLSTKTYGHEIGLSAAFRQHGAHSHCRFIHGYALAVKFVFAAYELDERNWVVDFGGLRGLKALLEHWFDHKLLVACDDPALADLERLGALGLAEVRVLKAVGCEAFSRFIYEIAEAWMREQGLAPRCRLVSVEVKEHGANSAIYAPYSFINGGQGSLPFPTINR